MNTRQHSGPNVVEQYHACCEQAERFITHRYDDMWKLCCGCVGWWEYHPINCCPWCEERLKEC